MTGESAPPAIEAPRLPAGLGPTGGAVLHLAGWDGGPAPDETEVRIGHDGRCLLIAFRAAYRALHVQPGLPRDRPAGRLWEWDVVEAFVSDRAAGLPYREYEVSPLGQWLALSFDRPRQPSTGAWRSHFAAEVDMGPASFEARLAIPFEEIASGPPVAGAPWRLGLYRIQGAPPARDHLAWPPVGGARPDFHQPGRWARLYLGV